MDPLVWELRKVPWSAACSWVHVVSKGSFRGLWLLVSVLGYCCEAIVGPDCLCCHAIAPVLFEWKAPLLLFLSGILLVKRLLFHWIVPSHWLHSMCFVAKYPAVGNELVLHHQFVSVYEEEESRHITRWCHWVSLIEHGALEWAMGSFPSVWLLPVPTWTWEDLVWGPVLQGSCPSFTHKVAWLPQIYSHNFKKVLINSPHSVMMTGQTWIGPMVSTLEDGRHQHQKYALACSPGSWFMRADDCRRLSCADPMQLVYRFYRSSQSSLPCTQLGWKTLEQSEQNPKGAAWAVYSHTTFLVLLQWLCVRTGTLSIHLRLFESF